MTLYVRLRSPQVTLQRRKRGCSLIVCPGLRKWGLIPSLSLIFLSVALASVALFVLFEVKEVQEPVEDVAEPRIGNQPFSLFTPPQLFFRGDFFRISALLNRSAPSIELSAQLKLNKLYSLNNKKDILNYYNWIKCKRKSGDGCANYTTVEKSAGRKNWWALKPCTMYPPLLEGSQFVSPEEVRSIKFMDPIFLSSMKSGGLYEPEDCLPRHSVAIIVPYKDRWTHLTTLANYLLPMLQHQLLKFRLFVVEQYGNETFNKGIIMNAGFLEALKEEMFHCFIFHDVDLLPENDFNMYSCPEMPRHLSIAVNELNYQLPYYELAGGAFAIRTDHFFRVNGYSNFFWGWGGEDDDMGMRVIQSGLKIIRPLPSIGRYTMILHTKQKPSDRLIRRRLLDTSAKRYRFDGLNSVEYTLIKKTLHPWYTALLVDVGKPHPSFKLQKTL